MGIGPGELRSLALVMREQKIAKLVTHDATIEMHPSAFTVGMPDAASAPIGVEHGGEPTPDQLLHWSDGGPLPSARPPDKAVE